MGKTFDCVRGEKHHSAVLTEKKVRKYRKLHEERGLCVKCCSIIANVSYSAMWDALKYNTWRHVR